MENANYFYSCWYKFRSNGKSAILIKGADPPCLMRIINITISTSNQRPIVRTDDTKASTTDEVNDLVWINSSFNPSEGPGLESVMIGINAPVLRRFNLQID